MKRIFLAALMVAALFIPTQALAATLYDYPRVAVVDIRNEAPVSWDINYETADQLASFIEECLTDANHFQLVERERLAMLMDEKSLDMAGVVSPGAASTQIDGVDYIVTGSIVGLSTKESSGAVGVWGVGAGGVDTHKVSAKIILKIIDASNGHIVMMAKGDGKSTSAKAGAMVSGIVLAIGPDHVSQEQVVNAVEKATEDAVFGERGIVAKLEGKAERRGH